MPYSGPHAANAQNARARLHSIHPHRHRDAEPDRAPIHFQMAPKSQQGAFASPEQCRQFRNELQTLQTQLRNYTGLLAKLADVEDLTMIEAEDL